MNEDDLRAHRGWTARGREGDGRLVLRGAALGESRTHGVMVDYAILESCDLVGAEITYSSFEHTEMSDCKFSDGSLYNSRFMFATLQRTQFERTNLRACWFTDATISECSFDNADLDDGNFVRAFVTRSSFRAARLETNQMDHGKFVACDFRGARLGDKAHGAQFVDCDLRGANLDGWRMKDTQFTRCRLAGVIGKPIIEGTFALTDSDFSTDEEVVGARSPDELRRYWEGT